MRCSKCILPDTVPGISFNENNECNYCEEKFPFYSPGGEDKLSDLLRANLRKDSAADCLVGLSGGKDSTYALITLKEKYKMRVEAFTYVHEGSAAFSIENAKETCKQLDIKHHIVSLENQLHLKTFTGFFEAWIKSPSVTTAGMTCVACKHFHILGSKIAEERNIPMIAWANSPLEYSPFLALKIIGNKKEQHKRESNTKGSVLLMKEILKTREFPLTFFKHFDTCYKGCLSAFPTSGYLKKKFPDITPVFFFEYHNWNPTQIKDFVKKRVDWKIPGKKDDWHSDCLFHFFKEYMFLSMLRASYTDGFLSNQIRYNLMTREEALLKLKESRKANLEGLLKSLEILNLQHLKNKMDLNVFSVDSEQLD